MKCNHKWMWHYKRYPCFFLRFFCYLNRLLNFSLCFFSSKIFFLNYHWISIIFFLFLIIALMFAIRINAFDKLKTKAKPINAINGSLVISCQVNANCRKRSFQYAYDTAIINTQNLISLMFNYLNLYFLQWNVVMYYKCLI